MIVRVRWEQVPVVRTMLTMQDREEISRHLAQNTQYVEIARRLGRDPSVISREVARHGGRAGYRAVAADQAARAGRERPKVLAVERSPRLRAVVTALLRRGWSPASIAGRLATDYPHDQARRVSHEAIYQWLYATPVSTLARELVRLRTERTARRGGRKPPSAPRIKDPVYSVSLVTVAADSPAVEPRNCPSAGTKSPEDRPCR